MLSLVVAPLAGAWIEILLAEQEYMLLPVAPLAGAWIEIAPTCYFYPAPIVAPLAGAWIEIRQKRCQINKRTRRSPCGSVD